MLCMLKRDKNQLATPKLVVVRCRRTRILIDSTEMLLGLQHDVRLKSPGTNSLKLTLNWAHCLHR